MYNKRANHVISYPYVGHFWPEANYCGYRSTFSAKYEGFYCLKFFEYRADVPNLSRLPGTTADFRARPPAHRGSEYRLNSRVSPTLVKTYLLFFNAHVQKYAINTPFWCHSGKFPGTFDILSDICRLQKPTFCTYIQKSRRSKLPGETCQDGVLKATMRCARRHARGHRLQWCRQRVGLLVNLYSVTVGRTVECPLQKHRYNHSMALRDRGVSP